MSDTYILPFIAINVMIVIFLLFIRKYVLYILELHERVEKELERVQNENRK